MKPSARTRARELALQALYQWQITGDDTREVLAQFTDRLTSKKIDGDYFTDLVQGTLANLGRIDGDLAPLLDRKIADLDMVELATLRLASYELLYRLDVPYKVVIDEALMVVKLFGSGDGYRYVNGVLDKLALLTRADHAGASATAKLSAP